MSTKLKMLLFAAGFSLLFLFGYSTATSAHSFRTGDTVSVSESETIDQSVFLAGKTLRVDGVINGDLFCAAETVTISGTINGDVMCAGMTMTISGHIEGDIRVAAQTIVQSGEVTGSATIASQSYTLEDDALVGRDLTGGVSNLMLAGEVDRDVALGAEDATIAGVIGRDVQGDIQQLSLTDSADVAGSIEYTSANEITRAGNARIGGEIIRSTPRVSTDDQRFFGVGLGFAMYAMITMILTSLVLVLLMPHALHSVTEHARQHFGKSLLIGFIASIVVPVALIMLLFSVVGIPLAIIFGSAWLTIVLLSGPFTAYFIGKKLLGGENRTILIMFTGTLVLLALYLVPPISVFAIFLTYWLGTGMILRSLKAYTPKPRYVLPATTEKTSSTSTKKSSKK